MCGDVLIPNKYTCTKAALGRGTAGNMSFLPRTQMNTMSREQAAGELVSMHIIKDVVAAVTLG